MPWSIFLALDADNPRAILFLIREMRKHAEALPHAEVHGRPLRIAARDPAA